MLDYRLRRPEVAEDEWTILSRSPAAFIKRYPTLAKQRGVKFRQGDVRSFDFGSEKYDAVIHAATEAVTTISDEEMTSVVVEGTRHVIDFAKACGAKKLMLTSSGAVYGPQISAVSEDAPCNPITAYGKGKLIAEEMCAASGLHTLLPRCFAFVGPYLNRSIHFAIGNFIQNCLDGVPIVINGDGTPYRSYLYADDLVEWLFAILERGESGRPYNVGSGVGLSIVELAQTVRSALGTTNPIEILGSPTGSPPSVYVPDISRAQQDLELHVSVSLEEAICRTVKL